MRPCSPLRVAALVCLLAGCAVAEPPLPALSSSSHAPGAVASSGRAWPEADALFRRDPRWLGGDAAISVDLGDDRILWLFGDSFVAPEGARFVAPEGARFVAPEGARFVAPEGAGRLGRRGAVMVRNSVAMQRGRDPTDARMRFVVREGPASFFPEEGERWFWPQQGILLDGALTLFLYRLAHAPGEALGFRYDGWTAVRVDAPAGPPESWTLRPLQVPDVAPVEMVGVALVAVGAHVVAYGVREPGDHALFALRWTRDDFVAGALDDPRLWAGPARGWTRGPPAPLFTDGQTELSVVARAGGGYALVQTLGFGAADIGLRLADAPHGPFDPAHVIFEPPERARSDVLIYGARIHPGLAEGALVLTYNVNSLDAATLLDDLSIYHPRFVRLEGYAPAAPPTLH